MDICASILVFILACTPAPPAPSSTVPPPLLIACHQVMDDNRLLTLPNRDRIVLRYPQCAMLFEVANLHYASPATVSRCGMVYVDPKVARTPTRARSNIACSHPHTHTLTSLAHTQSALACRIGPRLRTVLPEMGRRAQP